MELSRHTVPLISSKTKKIDKKIVSATTWQDGSWGCLMHVGQEYVGIAGQVGMQFQTCDRYDQRWNQEVCLKWTQTSNSGRESGGIECGWWQSPGFEVVMVKDDHLCGYKGIGRFLQCKMHHTQYIRTCNLGWKTCTTGETERHLPRQHGSHRWACKELIGNGEGFG